MSIKEYLGTGAKIIEIKAETIAAIYKIPPNKILIKPKAAHTAAISTAIIKAKGAGMCKSKAIMTTAIIIKVHVSAQLPNT